LGFEILIPNLSTVFQFRFAGPKGVLVPFDDEYLRKWFPDDFGKDVEIYLRGSQIKYDAWDYLTLDISDWSRSKSSFRCAKLQKAMIRILLDLGIPLKNFERLLEAELDRLSTVLDDRAKAINWLEGKSAVLESGEPYPTDTGKTYGFPRNMDEF
jgi:RNA-dependent RNA polymerase